ncbi:MAG: PadR family transcriptional regulator [Salinibacterium sp.]|nr:PadR family transcriptional regulator [Salinibacterium sp.]
MTETSFWILTALASGRRHGYAVLGDVNRLSAGSVALRVTTLYASLERLERDGCIRSAGDEVVDGRARRYYEILESGRVLLGAEAERLAARAAAAQVSIARGAAARLSPAPLTAVSV